MYSRGEGGRFRHLRHRVVLVRVVNERSSSLWCTDPRDDQPRHLLISLLPLPPASFKLPPCHSNFSFVCPFHPSASVQQPPYLTTMKLAINHCTSTMQAFNLSAAAPTGATFVALDITSTCKELTSVLDTVKDPAIRRALTTKLLLLPAPQQDVKRKAVNCFVGFRCEYQLQQHLPSSFSNILSRPLHQDTGSQGLSYEGHVRCPWGPVASRSEPVPLDLDCAGVDHDSG